MTKILSAIAIALVMNACNTAPDTTATTPTIDTTGIASFRAAQAQAEKDSIARWTKDSIIRSSRATTASRRTYTSSRSGNGSSAATTERTTATSESSNNATQSRVSKTAKGAIIGGVAGAAGGAIINKKNRAAGAVIGGVLGAGTGAVIGRRADKRDGRQ